MCLMIFGGPVLGKKFSFNMFVLRFCFSFKFLILLMLFVDIFVLSYLVFVFHLNF